MPQKRDGGYCRVAKPVMYNYTPLTPLHVETDVI